MSIIIISNQKKFTCRMCRLLLKGNGLTWEHANHGAETKKALMMYEFMEKNLYFQREKPKQIELIVVDGMEDGQRRVEFFQLIKSFNHLADIPIMMITAGSGLLCRKETSSYENQWEALTDHELYDKMRKTIQHKKDMRNKQHLFTKTFLQSALNAAVLVTMFDEQGVIFYVNDFFCKTSDYTKKELLGSSFKDLVDGNHAFPFLEETKQFGPNPFWKKQLRIIGKKGKMIWTETTILATRNNPHTRLQYIAVSTDITRLKEQEILVNNQLVLARKIQRNLMPAPLTKENIQIDYFYKASSQLSGDLCAWYQVDEWQYSVILIDVMGHGLPSSLITMGLRSLLPGLMTRVADPVKIFHRLEKFIGETTDQHTLIPSYFTAICLKIDLKNKQMSYINAGHPGALLKLGNEVLQLKPGYLPAGLVAQGYQSEKISLQDSCKLFMYTDGLLEGMKLNHVDGANYLAQKLISTASLLADVKEEFSLDENDGNDDICIVEIDFLGSMREEY